MRDENQLTAAVVELVAHEKANIKYSTVQNWYAAHDKDGTRTYNFVTKRGLCQGDHSENQLKVETGPLSPENTSGNILKGDSSIGEFYSVALTNNKMAADTGTKMIHLGKRILSKIISKGISTDASIKKLSWFEGIFGCRFDKARNHSVCDFFIIKIAKRQYLPLPRDQKQPAVVEHEVAHIKGR